MKISLLLLSVVAVGWAAPTKTKNEEAVEKKTFKAVIRHMTSMDSSASLELENLWKQFSSNIENAKNKIYSTMNYIGEQFRDTKGSVKPLTILQQQFDIFSRKVDKLSQVITEDEAKAALAGMFREIAKDSENGNPNKVEFFNNLAIATNRNPDVAYAHWRLSELYLSFGLPALAAYHRSESYTRDPDKGFKSRDVASLQDYINRNSDKTKKTMLGFLQTFSPEYQKQLAEERKDVEKLRQINEVFASQNCKWKGKSIANKDYAVGVTSEDRRQNYVRLLVKNWKISKRVGSNLFVKPQMEVFDGTRHKGEVPQIETEALADKVEFPVSQFQILNAKEVCDTIVDGLKALEPVKSRGNT